MPSRGLNPQLEQSRASFLFWLFSSQLLLIHHIFFLTFDRQEIHSLKLRAKSMAGTSSSLSSSSSSCASFSSFDDVSVKASSTVKFLCSYGGKILPRYPDGKLRYVGGETRVLAVDRSVSYSGAYIDFIFFPPINLIIESK